MSNNLSLAQQYVNHQDEQESEGRRLYDEGRPRGVCRNPAQLAGWDAAYSAGADAYWRCMVAEASDVEMDVPTHVVNGEWF